MKCLTINKIATDSCGYFFFIGRLLVFGIAMFPLIVEKILNVLLIQKIDWKFKPEVYFLSPGQPPKDPRTSLLIINNTGEEKNSILIQKEVIFM